MEPLAVAVNVDKYNSLSDAQKEIVLDVAREAVDMQRQLSISKEDEIIA